MHSFLATLPLRLNETGPELAAHRGHLLIDGNDRGRVDEGDRARVEPQLAPLVPAPAKEEAILGEGHRVAGAGAHRAEGVILGDLQQAGQCLHGRRRGPAQAQLTRFIPPKNVDVAGLGEDQRVPAPGGNGFAFETLRKFLKN